VTRGATLPSEPWTGRVWRPQLGNRPMLWKELFAEQAVRDLNVVARIVTVLLLVGIMVPVGVTFYKCYTGIHRREVFQGLANFLGGFIGCCFLLVLSARAASSVSTERE
jgi:hypothetical protein